ncbi:MAG: transcription antitermination factor NusB [Planctomycetota bacterium]
MTRRRAREIALQVLYADDLNPSRNLAIAEEFVRRRLNHHPTLVKFSNELIAGVRRNRVEIDKLLGRLAKNWSVERMAVIDRNVMRLATYEILHGDTPPRVAINEALELAKRYGARQSSQFVNGILDRVIASRTATASATE